VSSDVNFGSRSAAECQRRALRLSDSVKTSTRQLVIAKPGTGFVQAAARNFGRSLVSSSVAIRAVRDGSTAGNSRGADRPCRPFSSYPAFSLFSVASVVRALHSRHVFMTARHFHVSALRPGSMPLIFFPSDVAFLFIPGCPSPACSCLPSPYLAVSFPCHP